MNTSTSTRPTTGSRRTRRWVALAALGLAGAACGLPSLLSSPPEPIIVTPQLVTVTAVTAEANPPASASATLPAGPTASATPLPTPVTTFSSSVSSQVFGDVTVVTVSNFTRYALVGQTALELDQHMRQVGPPDSAGTRWFALTEPLFNWEDTCVCDGNGCVTGPVSVTVTVNYTLPTWDPPGDADPVLVGQWAFFEDAVATHERGHGDSASTCGQWLGEAFVALPPQPSCEGVDSAMSGASGAVFAECRAAQGAYEAQTNHGQNDGVLWPP